MHGGSHTSRTERATVARAIWAQSVRSFPTYGRSRRVLGQPRLRRPERIVWPKCFFPLGTGAAMPLTLLRKDPVALLRLIEGRLKPFQVCPLLAYERVLLCYLLLVALLGLLRGALALCEEVFTRLVGGSAKRGSSGAQRIPPSRRDSTSSCSCRMTSFAFARSAASSPLTAAYACRSSWNVNCSGFI